MSFPYKKVLVVGATSGIGQALAERMIENGISVIAVGRRQERIDEFVEKNGKEKASGIAFDLTARDKIPDFVTTVIEQHPDLDCVFLNSGIQRGINFAEPETVDMGVIETELSTNYLSQVAMTKAFLPFLQTKKGKSALLYTTSSLALIPYPRCLNYCASKAAMHQFLLSLRQQLLPSQVRVIEIFPPLVQTELHDKKHQPDIEDGANMGMPLNEFIDETWDGLSKGKDEIPVQMGKEWYDAFEPQRQAVFKKVYC